MYTLILFICATGFFCLYNSSAKAKLSGHGALERWLQSNQQAARLFGLSGLLLATTGLILLDGAVMGTVHGLLMIMTAACYTIGLAPFRLFRWLHLVTIGVLAFLLECLIF